ncbi:hypothetical protein [Streptomyces sp. TRM68367]|uniref:hypothetical protein n=1 Tax=Streptomyces sp. TRM68367 TaxID=2758415 RepID=UPI00165A6E08|nr:hypothetical protein [Streptomyces sp. TRM68367]MBC9724890.1 hypothetical protein [Streptomyces sp. TRM68367]
MRRHQPPCPTADSPDHHGAVIVAALAVAAWATRRSATEPAYMRMTTIKVVVAVPPPGKGAQTRGAGGLAPVSSPLSPHTFTNLPAEVHDGLPAEYRKMIASMTEQRIPQVEDYRLSLRRLG